MIDWLHKTERLLESFFERSDIGSRSRVAPLDLVRQIQKEIDRNRLPFINDQILVPHRMVIHLFAPSQMVVDEYEALFNTAEFREYVERYIQDRGFKLLDHLRIGIQCHQDRVPGFDRSGCFIEFSWPQPSADPGEVTITMDGIYGNHISVNAPYSEIPMHASLEVLEGTAYRTPVDISFAEFNLGRTQNIIHESSGKLLRTNHLAFARPEPGDVVNRSVSRRHATIVWNGSDFVLYDSGSENGTRIERTRQTIFVSPGGEGSGLEFGDVIRLGRARIRFRQGAAAAEQD